jgi:hypothetical protein
VLEVDRVGMDAVVVATAVWQLCVVGLEPSVRRCCVFCKNMLCLPLCPCPCLCLCVCLCVYTAVIGRRARVFRHGI